MVSSKVLFRDHIIIILLSLFIMTIAFSVLINKNGFVFTFAW